MNGDCEYVHDGFDTDGTEWFRCTTHAELAPSKDAPCAGYEEIPYLHAYQEGGCVCGLPPTHVRHSGPPCVATVYRTGKPEPCGYPPAEPWLHVNRDDSRAIDHEYEAPGGITLDGRTAEALSACGHDVFVTDDGIVPTCDLCNGPQRAEGDDWNGDSGNHHSCEERASREALVGNLTTEEV